MIYLSFLCIFFISVNSGSISDLYQILGLGSDSEPSSAQIRRAYRKLSLKYHPDKNPGDALAAQKFREVQEAYDKLSDEDARRIYEQYGEEEFHSKWQYERAKRMGKIKGGEADFYSGFDMITALTRKTFWKSTQEGSWLLKFYAPWCVHCQNSIAHLKKGAILLEGMAQVGAVNCEANERLCNRLDIRSYPTFAYRHIEEDMPFEIFEGEHEPEQFYSFVQELQQSGLVALDFFNFEDEVIQGEEVWLVTFTAGEWCPPCQYVKSVVRRTSFRLRGIVNCGNVNCDENGELCATQGIEYYPSFKIYPRGKGRSGIELEYGGSQFPQFDLLNLIAQIAPLILPTKSHKEKLVDFFEEHDADRLTEVDELLEDWENREEELFQNLEERYVPDKFEL